MAKGSRQEAATASLIAAANFVKRRTRAVRARREDEFRPVAAERDSLTEWFKRSGKILSEGYCRQFHAIGGGAEHDVYMDLHGQRAVKVTRGNRFGWSISYPGAHATPLEYMRRLVYHNWFFGDDIELVGAILSDDHIEVVTSQTWIHCDRTQAEPTEAQIDQYFAALAFKRSTLYPEGAMYYSPEFDIVAADAHARNVLLSSDGHLHPIDIVIGRPGKDLAAALNSEFAVEGQLSVRTTVLAPDDSWTFFDLP